MAKSKAVTSMNNKKKSGSNWKEALAKAHEATRKIVEQRRAEGIFPLQYMRLTLTEDAMKVVGKMSNGEFSDFVSEAIIRYAKTKRKRPAK